MDFSWEVCPWCLQLLLCIAEEIEPQHPDFQCLGFVHVCTIAVGNIHDIVQPFKPYVPVDWITCKVSLKREMGEGPA